MALLLRLGARLDEGRYRRIFCSRDLNMAKTKWVGFDMDYTLAVYEQGAFDALCHELTVARLVERFEYPEAIKDIAYDAGFAIRGLAVDRLLGNILKIDAHGHVEHGWHGLTAMEDAAVDAYRKDPPALSDERYIVLDTLFELPEAFMYAALVDFLDARSETVDYEQVASDVRESIDSIHADGTLKTQVTADLPRFFKKDRRLGAVLHRLRSAGKKLFLMTNSYYQYTNTVMTYLLDDGPADYANWRSYFDVIITGAQKPNFFKLDRPAYVLDQDGEVVQEETQTLRRGVVYQHGNLRHLEESIGASADEILYVGDHIYGDILVSKKDSRWRTMMVIPELEHELECLESVSGLVATYRDLQEELAVVREALLCETEIKHMLATSEEVDRTFDSWTAEERAEWNQAAEAMVRNSDRLARRGRDLVRQIRALSSEVDRQFHERWGPLMKSGNEHSVLGMQVERYADLYTSRVTNLLAYSPMQYHRSPRDLLPHELDHS